MSPMSPMPLTTPDSIGDARAVHEAVPALTPVAREVLRPAESVAANEPDEAAVQRAALKEALDAIEQSARYCWIVGKDPVSQEQFESDWRENDQQDYDRWVRLKRVALNDPRFREEELEEFDDDDDPAFRNRVMYLG